MAIGSVTAGPFNYVDASPASAAAPSRAVGDRLVAICFLRGSTASQVSVTQPSGWLRYANAPYYSLNGAGRGIDVFERDATNTSADNFSATFSGGGGGVNVTAIIVKLPGGSRISDHSGAHHDNSAVTNVIFGSGVSATKGRAILALGLRANDGDPIGTLSGASPTFAELGEFDESSDDDMGCAVDVYVNTTSATVSTGTSRSMSFGAGTGQSTAVYLVVSPVAAATASRTEVADQLVALGEVEAEEGGGETQGVVEGVEAPDAATLNGETRVATIAYAPEDNDVGEAVGLQRTLAAASPNEAGDTAAATGAAALFAGASGILAADVATASAAAGIVGSAAIVEFSALASANGFAVVLGGLSRLEVADGLAAADAPQRYSDAPAFRQAITNQLGRSAQLSSAVRLAPTAEAARHAFARAARRSAGATPRSRVLGD